MQPIFICAQAQKDKICFELHFYKYKGFPCNQQNYIVANSQSMGGVFVRNSILSCQTKPTELSFASCFSQVFVDCMCDTKDAKKYIVVVRQAACYLGMFVKLKQHRKNRLKSSKVRQLLGIPQPCGTYLSMDS